jgi:UDP-N-acetylglucosamine 2-epimerase (non-hydrolysing)
MAAMKIISVVGARPNFMKVAPIIRAIEEHNRTEPDARIQHLLVHTGQHYDAFMSDQFFADLGLPKPDVHLGVGSSSQASQTAEILEKFERVLIEENPDAVVVVGDVNSTVACALATAKFPVPPGGHRPLIAHVESGLRSFDRAMPEEINRVVTDHLADLLFVTEKSGVTNLRREGIPAERVFFVGNTMIDSLIAFKERADASPILEKLGLRTCGDSAGIGNSRSYALLTLHRPSNVDDPATFESILLGISELSQKMEIVFPVHPRTRNRIEEFGADRHFQPGNSSGKMIRCIDPLGYLDFLCLMKNARLVLTDSGGIQEETTCLGVPCVTIRNNTERPVTMKLGTNVIAGTSPSGIRHAIARQLSRKTKACIPEKWDGRAAERIVRVIANSVRGTAALEAVETHRPAVDVR